MATKLTKSITREIDLDIEGHWRTYLVTLNPETLMIEMREKNKRVTYAVPIHYVWFKGAELRTLEDHRAGK